MGTKEKAEEHRAHSIPVLRGWEGPMVVSALASAAIVHGWLDFHVPPEFEQFH